MVGQALRPVTVERIYALRGRDVDKACIILIGELADLERLHISLDDRTSQLLGRVWPGPVSVVLACNEPAMAHLHRGLNSLAIRMPADPALRELLRQTGPLVAPSANLQNHQPAGSIKEAQAYFADGIDLYVDGGGRHGAPSALVDLRTNPPRVLRPAPGFEADKF